MGAAVQFIVDQGDKLVQGCRFTPAPQVEQLRDLLRGTFFIHATPCQRRAAIFGIGCNYIPNAFDPISENRLSAAGKASCHSENRDPFAH